LVNYFHRYPEVRGIRVYPLHPLEPDRDGSSVDHLTIATFHVKVTAFDQKRSHRPPQGPSSNESTNPLASRTPVNGPTPGSDPAQHTPDEKSREKNANEKRLFCTDRASPNPTPVASDKRRCP
jgi:hypothetical protein